MRKAIIFGCGVVGAIQVFSQTQKPKSAFYKRIVMPIARKIDPEISHKLAILCAKYGFFPRSPPDDPILKQTCWGREFSNPIGLAAGFDKNAEAIDGMRKVGFGFVEIGSVCPKSQPGNDKPRAFRSVEDQAIINRYGFNSDGADVVEKRIEDWYPNNKGTILGINLGKNKTTENAAEDYVIGVQKLGRFVDYLVINVSSPNTPNLRELQEKDPLQNIINRVKEARDTLEMPPGKQKPPLLIKIAPDLQDFQKENIASVSLSSGIDGIIISNTTTNHQNLKNSNFANEAGGLSGKPLFDASTSILRDMYKLTEGKITLIGTGGIFSGQDALTKIENGASLVQLYTSMALNGPGVVTEIKEELASLLKQNGYKTVNEAIGKKVNTDY